MIRFLKGQLASFIPSSATAAYQRLPSHWNSRSTTPDSTPSPSSSALYNFGDLYAAGIPSPRVHHYMHMLQQWLFLLLPSFVQHRLRPSTYKAPKLHPTSYLDGVRGLAAFIVFFCHFTEGTNPWFTNFSWGHWNPEDTVKSSSFLQLPYVRLIWSGRPMVHLFFYISGFVLSAKALRLIHKNDMAGVTTTLSSSVFRRAIRLFIPCVASSFFAMIIIHNGYGVTEWYRDTWTAQISDWLNALLWEITFSWDWATQKWPRYDNHLWTIPIEFAHSMLLFITVLGLARCKTWVRLLTVFAIMLYCLHLGQWAAFEFLGGMLLSEISLIKTLRANASLADKEAASLPRSSHTSLYSSISTCFWTACVIFVLYIYGWENAPQDGTFFANLAQWAPQVYIDRGYTNVQFFYFALAGFVFMLALLHLPRLQSFFTTSFIQYLANISFSLYIVHGPILDVIRIPITEWVVSYITTETITGRTVGWVVEVSLMLPPVIVVADLFWRTFDTQSIRFARWTEEQCLCKED